MNKEQMIKNRIIAVAKEISAVSGHDKLTVSNICSNCAISRSTFYKYFPSKEVLLNHLESLSDAPSQNINNMRDLILYTATKLIAEKGFDHVNMNDIAKKIGVNRTALYSYFSSISDIAKYILANELSKREMFEDETEINDSDTINKFEQYVDYHINLLDNKKNQRLFIELLENCYVNPGIKDGIDSIEKLSISNMAQVIEAGKKTGIFPREVDEKVSSTLMYIFSYGIAVYSYLHPECDLKNDLKAPILEFLLNGVKAK